MDFSQTRDSAGDREHDEPLLAPGRLIRAVVFWVWINCDDAYYLKGKYIPLFQVIRGFRRPYAGRSNY